jgi:hypothetical protein
MMPGEPPLVMKTQYMNVTIGKVFFADLEGTKFGDGLAEIILPSCLAMGLSIADTTKDFVNLMV